MVFGRFSDMLPMKVESKGFLINAKCMLRVGVHSELFGTKNMFSRFFQFSVRLFLITRTQSVLVTSRHKTLFFCASADYKTIDLHRLMLTKRFHSRDNQKTFPKGL